jgi:hypothetical protein
VILKISPCKTKPWRPCVLQSLSFHFIHQDLISCLICRTCLRYFLPPQWPMEKEAIANLNMQELASFPLDEFFDHYEKGLRKVTSTFRYIKCTYSFQFYRFWGISRSKSQGGVTSNQRYYTNSCTVTSKQMFTNLAIDYIKGLCSGGGEKFI